MRTVGLLLLLFFLHPGAMAEDLAELAKLEPLSARAHIAGSNQVSPGSQIELKIDITLVEQFFAYGDRFSLKFKSPENISHGELFISPLVDFADVVSKKKKRGVHKSATASAQVILPNDLDSDLQELEMSLTYIACTKKFCLLPKTVELKVAVEVVAKKAASAPSGAIGQNIGEQIESNLWFALLLIYFFGFLTSFTPCVYPLIPITLAVLGSNENRSKSASLFISFAYVIGIALTYALLGVIAAQTGQLFGSFISHPIVTITTSLIFLAMGLSLFGLFELQAPARIRNRFQNYQGQKGPLGAFISGSLAGVVASPCVGPVLVGVLAYIAQSQDSFLGFTLLFVFAMGFGTLFLVLGTFSQLAHKLPSSGLWMNRVKYLLGVCMIVLAAYYSWPLVKGWLPQSSTSIAIENGVQWKKFSPEKVNEAKAKGLPMIIDFYADWCAACVELDKFTFTKESIIEKSKEFVMLKIDATTPFDELPELQRQYDVYGLPTMIFIDKSGEVRKDLTLTGFEEAPLFIKRMEGALGEKTPDGKQQ